MVPKQHPNEDGKAEGHESKDAQDGEVGDGVPHGGAALVNPFDDHGDDPRQTDAEGVGEEETHDKDVDHEPEVVLFADARADPRTVVVVLLDAVVADVAVGGPGRPEDLVKPPDTSRRT